MASQNKKCGKYLYLVSADEVEDFGGYDTYSDFVACADSEEEVRKLHPDGEEIEENYRGGTWINLKDIDKLKVTLLGRAVNTKKGVILASFHAG